MKSLVLAGVLIWLGAAWAAEIPEEAHPECWESLKAAKTGDRTALNKLADQSTECQALPPFTVKFLIGQAALLGELQK